FILALLITLVASLGISGIPGTATVLTSGVLSGLGLGAWFGPVYAIVGSLDGLFDMGRTGVNVTSGAVVATLVAKNEGLIGADSNILSAKLIAKQEIIRQKQIDKEAKRELKMQEKLAKINAKKEKSNNKQE
ncbi:cation:dicarboxylase symporter family transporter, partial [Xanthomonas citri pv. citri]|nr:cation:dicarboxylase symporter family transporter [Xanthomonas citri pv. citri]